MDGNEQRGILQVLKRCSAIASALVVLYLTSFAAFLATRVHEFSLAPSPPYSRLLLFSMNTNAHLALRAFYAPLVSAMSSKVWCPVQHEHEALAKATQNPWIPAEEPNNSVEDIGAIRAESSR